MEHIIPTVMSAPSTIIGLLLSVIVVTQPNPAQFSAAQTTLSNDSGTYLQLISKEQSSPAPIKEIYSTAPSTTEDHAWDFLQPKTYTTKSGDTLASIAQAVYGDSAYWSTLWNDNQWIENPSNIYSGWDLTIRKNQPTEADLALAEPFKQRLAELHRPIQQIAYAQVEIKHNATASAQPVPNVAVPQEAIKEVAQAIKDSGDPSNFDELYKKAGEKYGIPWQVLYGIHKTETGNRGSGMIMNHSGSGATGPMQFMPGTWRAYGQDCNGDGVADIANVEDAVCGAANFMQKHGTIMQGLRSYGGNISGTLRAAQDRGFDTAQIN